MNFSIKYKLLLTFFVATVSVVGAMWFLIDWSFDRGFLQYVNTVEEESMGRMVTLLSEDYKSAGGWESLVHDGRRWWEYGFSAYARSQNRANSNNQDDTAPSNRLDENSSNQAPATVAEADRTTTTEQHRRRYTRLILLDKDKGLLIGRYRDLEEMTLLPISINGETVGYLGSRPSSRLNEFYDLRFSEQQGRAFTLIALATLLIATILILPMSRNLVKPINRLAQATRELASGNYSVRIPNNSKDEIGQLSQDFNSLANTLEQNEDARRQWIADISHELRTPLSVLRGEIESIQDGIREPDQERLNALHGEVMNLNRLIDDLYELSLSDIGALSYQKQKVDVDETIELSLDSLRDEFEKKQINISFNKAAKPAHTVFADADRLHQLFSNLLTNSMRYTDSPGELTITVEKQGDRVIISFQDSGPGVSDADLPRLFERLFRVESSRNRSSGGAGLGLSICKNIVEAHEGTISAQRSPINGLWIKIDLPFEA